MRLGTARRFVAGLAVAASLGCVGTARAQHVVTEDEAAKLTLEALTAPPPRPVYRSLVRRASASRIVWRGHASWRSGDFARAADLHRVHHVLARRRELHRIRYR